MRRRLFVGALAAAGVKGEGAWRPLFNGRTLEGWVQDAQGVWSVVDGMIRGRHAGMEHNDFLRTREQFSDFELTVDFRLTGGVGNTGVQFRSLPSAIAHELAGYQADVGEKYWGALYDESRRRRILAQAPAEFLVRLDKAAWHTYTVRARGLRVEVGLDGTPIVDYTETETGLVQRGYIGLQIHKGAGMEVWFRNIRVREL
jgi:hypothetical protein